VGHAYDALNIARDKSPVEIAAYLASFEEAERILAEGTSAVELIELRKKSPDLYQAFIDYAAHCDRHHTGPKEWMELRVATETKGSVSFIAVVCEGYLKYHKDRPIYQWIHEHYDEVRESLSHYLETRLMNAIRRDNFQRVQDDLNRAYSRTLADFRRHRNWRRERDIITVVPEPAAAPSTEAKSAETKVMQRGSKPHSIK
jgi:hypothetical protein